MKIGILYICTGAYTVFWKDFYLSCEKNFIPEAEKEYFVFTDADEIEFEKSNNAIHRIFQKNLGWPGNTLHRYDVFLRHAHLFQECKYLCYMNANLEFVQKITAEEFLPHGGARFVAVLHPGYYDMRGDRLPYERNPQSNAYIPKHTDGQYLAGGINGGETVSMIEAMESLSKCIQSDIARGVVAVWHDESHWNKFIHGRHDVKILSPAYLYPEEAMLPVVMKIKIRDKNIRGGHASLRGKREARLMINKMKKVIRTGIAWCVPSKVVTIQGGLGNQMFQYAYGRNLEFLNKKVIFDISFFETRAKHADIQRKLSLFEFAIGTRCVFSSRTRIWRIWWRRVRKVLGIPAENYFQGERFFARSAEIIRSEFILKRDFSPDAQCIRREIREAGVSVALHVRRGDYVTNAKTNAYHGVCGMEYYESAIRYMRAQTDSPRFFIFSDDISWAREHFVGPEYVYVSRSSIADVEEMMLMSMCMHAIIANSSFSWWGAWLNSNPEKIVIAPKQWFKNERANARADIIPREWISL